MQGFGSLISVLVVVVCLSLGASAAFTWRFALAFGAVPALVAFPYRLRMHETETFERVKRERLLEASYNSNGSNSSPSPYSFAFAPVDGDGEEEDGLGMGLDNTILNYDSMNASMKRYQKHKHMPGSDGGVVPVIIANNNENLFDMSGNDNNNNNSNSNINHTTINTSNNTVIERNTSFNSQSPRHSLSTLNNNMARSYNANETSKLRAGSSTSQLNKKGKKSSAQINVRYNELATAFTYYKWHMFGTAACWFLLDVDFYANGLFNHDVTSLILTAKGSTTTALQDAYNSAILCGIGKIRKTRIIMRFFF
jgi:hypothetical protein